MAAGCVEEWRRRVRRNDCVETTMPDEDDTPLSALMPTKRPFASASELCLVVHVTMTWRCNPQTRKSETLFVPRASWR
jgi:hypothetical protein